MPIAENMGISIASDLIPYLQAIATSGEDVPLTQVRCQKITEAADALSQLTREVEVLREAAQQARKAISEAARDTLWCDETRPAETVVDRIDAALSRSSGDAQ